ncbi:hypothetical protein ACGFIF_42880 [Kribbella sp. NPDC049174]|uniref:ParB family protein n=1 Tax=Kribbella sp. NPDC049174 TaxID=3364112 RepID=UPI0037145C83
MSDENLPPPTPAPKAQKWRIQAWIYDEDDDSRIRNAMWAVGHREGYADLSDFIVRTMLEKVEELEAKYNNGRPFQPPTAQPRGRGRGRSLRPGKAVE